MNPTCDATTFLFFRDVQNGNVESTAEHLSKGADLEAKDPIWEKTPLITAAGNGHQDIVQLLVNKGAEVNAEDKFGCTALYDAAISLRLEVVNYLLSVGANVQHKDNNGTTLLPRVCEYIVHTSYNRRNLFDDCTQANNEALTNKKAILNALCNAGASLEEKTFSGITAKTYLAMFNFPDIFNENIEKRRSTP